MPFAIDSATLRIGPSHQPSTPVMSSSSATPRPLLRLAAMANCRPITPASTSTVLMIGLAMTTAAVCMPIQAPITVGTIVSASSRYVLRRTFCAPAAV
jgi:hypothetical protein